MSDNSDSRQLSPLKQAYLALEEMQAKLDGLDRLKKEPIAIIGMGCRFPGGGNDPENFWRLLHDGVDTVTVVPADRWNVVDYYDPDPDAPGKMITKWGAFLERVDMFDPQFFGIAPREAIGMDPQQRLLLEVSWEALERAGQSPDRLEGSRTGVFVGTCTTDYAHLQMKWNDLTRIDAHYASGVAQSMLAGRLSYILGLQGPSISLDTACSSSLIAIHLACRSLCSGECQMALAGGVNVILLPDNTIALSKSGMMAADGRCKTFDASADGFVRGEGCGIVVLKRFSDAIVDGDHILALIRGTAVNQDGPASGLTAPNGPAQEAVIREALANASLDPSQVSYVEAHGTGTILGDPIEVQALGKIFGAGRSDGDLLKIGSIKTNCGHLEAAAGIAGLIKTVLALQHAEIPPHLHFKKPNPHIAWGELSVRVPTELTPWAPLTGQRIAGVSSFGFSGTNAHVVLQEAPEVEPKQAEMERPLHLLTLSAKSKKALQELAGRYEHHLATHSSDLLTDVCFTANAGRSHFDHRLAMVTGSLEQVQEQLAAFVRGERPGGVLNGQTKSTDRPRVVFLFTGQGSQYMGMGRELYETQPTFHKALDRCDKILGDYLDRSLLSVLYPEGDASAKKPLLDQTAYTQPALFSIEYALAELWRSWGIEPSALMGHSVGEYVAACVAGIFSLEDGLKLIAERGRLMQALPRGGRMAAVFTNEERIAEVIKGFERTVSIAAVNGPENVVISGKGADLETIFRRLEEDKTTYTPLYVSHAFHSPLMEPILIEFEKVASKVRYSPPRIRLISNISGKATAGDEMANAAYWRRHIRKPVLFSASTRTLYAQGYRVFVEIGPHPVLLGMAAQCLPDDDGVYVPSLRRGQDDWEQVLESAADLYVHGAGFDWEGFDRDYPRRRIPLPTYPFRRKRYWIQGAGKSHQDPMKHPSIPAIRPLSHPMLGHWLRSPLKDNLFEIQLSCEAFPFLADHVVHGFVVLPATGYLEMVMAAAREFFGAEQVVLQDLTIREAMLLPDEGSRMVHLILSPKSGGEAIFQVFSLDEEDGESEWKLHATGNVRVGGATRLGSPEPAESFAAIKDRCSREIDVDNFYQGLWGRGLQFGPTFRGVYELWRRDGEALAQIRFPQPLPTDIMGKYQIHPALMDACIQIVAAAVPNFDPKDFSSDIYMPIGLDRFQINGRAPTHLSSHALIERLDGANQETLTAHVRLSNENGERIAQIEGLHLKRVDPETLRRGKSERLDEWLYQVEWQPRALCAREDRGASYLLDPAKIGKRIEPRLLELGEEHGVAIYEDLNRDLDALCAAYIVKGLRQLGWSFRMKERTSLHALAGRLGVADQHRRLLGRFLQILSEEGILAEVGEEWEVLRPPDEADPEEEYKTLLEKYSVQDVELILTRRCGGELSALLRCEADPLQLLFPGGDLEFAAKIYKTTPLAKTFNSIVKESIKLAIERLPEGKKIRVLEVGAGTGGTTSYVLPELPVEWAEYVFTDIGQSFLTRAAGAFSDYPFVKYQILDIEKDPVVQGFTPNHFDIVIASNVIHATADLKKTMKHVKQLLTSKGMLVMMEGTRQQRWFDLTFGFTEGWWKFADLDLRSSSPLLNQRQWSDLLEETGFYGAVTIPSVDTSRSLADNVVILARAPQIEGEQAVSHARREFSTQTGLGKWLIFSDRGGVGEKMAQSMKSRGQNCILVSPGTIYEAIDNEHYKIDPARPEDYHKLLREVLGDDRPPCSGVIHLWSLDDLPTEEITTARLEQAQIRGCRSALHLVQALATSDGSDSPALWLVTRGAQPVGSELNSLVVAHAPVWGLGKVIALEHPELNCVRVDLDPSGHSDEVQTLFEEIQSGDREDQVAYRNKVRYVARLVHSDSVAQAESETRDFPSQPLQLEVSTPGVLDNLVFRPMTRREAGSGEVEIRVHATGLNFRDVLIALGMYPGESGPVGGECSGEIVALGKDVEGFHVGDKVIALSRACFSTFTTARADLVVHKPDHFSFEEASTILSAFMTAYYTLHHIAKISADDRILIHAAAGGVGLAAVQFAQKAGAEILATAGNMEKREYLKSLGIHHVMNSRSLDFADEVMEHTDGQGVDIILNSLAGEFIPKSLSVLRAEGRFLEIGKRDIWDERQVKQLKSDVSYSVIDLAEECQQSPSMMGSILRTLMDEFNKGDLKPLPMRVFPIKEVVEAFRYMERAKHIGKIVVSHFEQIEDRGSWAMGSSKESLILCQNSTYLITGGLGGLGLLVAQWMVEHGARHLLLMSRSGASNTPNEVISKLEQTGAQVVFAQGDVSREEDVRRALSRAAESLPPLRGVVHAAGVLDDGVLLRQDWERFARVLAPKVEGAWNLHTLTQNLPLDFFVLFSSISSVLGSPGQGNHAAANAFLDVLAHYRRAHMLPGLSINWGAWSEVGAAAERNVGDRINIHGMGTISPDQGLRVFERLLRQNLAQVGVMPVDWPKFTDQFGDGRQPLFFSELDREKKHLEAKTGQIEVDGSDILQELEQATPSNRFKLLLEHVRDQAMKILGLDSTQPIDCEEPLHELGLDSLMAVELRNLLGTSLGLKRGLPATLVFDRPTVFELTDYVARKILAWETPVGSKTKQRKKGSDLSDALEQIEQLSDDDVDKLFTDKMEGLD